MSQTMTTVRPPRCASYQAVRRLIHDPTDAGREGRITVRRLSVDDGTHANLPGSAAGEFESPAPAGGSKQAHSSLDQLLERKTVSRSVQRAWSIRTTAK